MPGRAGSHCHEVEMNEHDRQFLLQQKLDLVQKVREMISQVWHIDVNVHFMDKRTGQLTEYCSSQEFTFDKIKEIREKKGSDIQFEQEIIPFGMPSFGFNRNGDVPFFDNILNNEQQNQN